MKVLSPHFGRCLHLSSRYAFEDWIFSPQLTSQCERESVKSTNAKAPHFQKCSKIQLEIVWRLWIWWLQISWLLCGLWNSWLSESGIDLKQSFTSQITIRLNALYLLLFFIISFCFAAISTSIVDVFDAYEYIFEARECACACECEWKAHAALSLALM